MGIEMEEIAEEAAASLGTDRTTVGIVAKSNVKSVAARHARRATVMHRLRQGCESLDEQIGVAISEQRVEEVATLAAERGRIAEELRAEAMAMERDLGDICTEVKSALVRKRRAASAAVRRRGGSGGADNAGPEATRSEDRAKDIAESLKAVGLAAYLDKIREIAPRLDQLSEVRDEQLVAIGVPQIKVRRLKAHVAAVLLADG